MPAKVAAVVCALPGFAFNLEEPQYEPGTQAEPGEGAWAVALEETCGGQETQHTACDRQQTCAGCIPHDCGFQDWSEWGAGDCTGLCARHRNIAKNNNECGSPCEGPRVETKNSPECKTCHDGPDTDCKWGDWEDWGECDVDCGSGQMTRSRGIQMYPENHGELCSNRTTKETTSCDTGKMCGALCIDGEWSAWEDWSACSHACQGGTRLRSRHIATEANECGRPVRGLGQEFDSCNVDVTCHPDNSQNCIWNDWSEWSGCSCTCHGINRRSRGVKQFGRGDGTFCEGAYNEIRACNPPMQEGGTSEACEAEPSVDCEMSDWTEWGLCSSTCGGGEHTRERTIIHLHRHQGQPCTGSLSEVKECFTNQCPAPEIIDCAWGPWSEWSACHKCGGEKRRTRVITTMPSKGGTPCTLQASEGYHSCPRHCHERSYCSWQEWSAWGVCSTTCGEGTRKRSRQLGKVSMAQVKADYKLLEETLRMQNDSGHEKLASFVAGCVSVVLVLGSVRSISSRRRAAYEQLQQVPRFGEMLVE